MPLMRVAVLGCGPAGLMAAQGIADWAAAVNIAVFSRKHKSPLYGAQYLHEPIEGFTHSDPVNIDYTLEGSTAGYALKVYGPQFNGRVSPQDLMTPHKGWDIRETYANLWTAWEPYIRDAWITPMWLHELRDQYKPDIIISSLPRDFLCIAGHYFGAAQVIIAGDAPEQNIKVPYPCAENTVVCNGEPDVSWYRKSRIFGHTTVEWPASIVRAPVNSAATVRKPTSTNCDCHPDIHWVGRYGRWEKGVLSHEAYSAGAELAVKHAQA